MTTESAFDITHDTMVITTKYVTQDHMPVLYVSYEEDEEAGIVWQFHAGNDDYRPEVLQLVRLDTVLALDPGLSSVGGLGVGFSARRRGVVDDWVVSSDSPIGPQGA